jgi:hypothetical protein
MPARYFSSEEANALLPQLRPLMGELLARRARIVRVRHDIADVLEDEISNTGSREASYVAQDLVAIEKLAKKIRAYGCVIKDLNAGLLDFLAEHDGREVYLCWRYGEPHIEFYHELHTGFSGRQRL